MLLGPKSILMCVRVASRAFHETQPEVGLQHYADAQYFLKYLLGSHVARYRTSETSHKTLLYYNLAYDFLHSQFRGLTQLVTDRSARV